MVLLCSCSVYSCWNVTIYQEKNAKQNIQQLFVVVNKFNLWLERWTCAHVHAHIKWTHGWFLCSLIFPHFIFRGVSTTTWTLWLSFGKCWLFPSWLTENICLPKVWIILGWTIEPPQKLRTIPSATAAFMSAVQCFNNHPFEHLDT